MKKSIDDIDIEYSRRRILFSTMISSSVISIPILLLLSLGLFSSSTFFVFGADPAMPSPSPSPSSPSMPPVNIAEKPGGIPPSTTSTTTTDIETLIAGVWPKKPPKVDEKIDSKDGGIILSSNIKKDLNLATKVAKDANKKTYNNNRGYVDGITVILRGAGEGEPEELPKSISDLKYLLSQLQIGQTKPYKQWNEEYLKGYLKGMEDALMLDDTLSIITLTVPKKSN
jgi:hypothetical protein